MTSDREEMEQALDNKPTKSGALPWEEEKQKLIPEAAASATCKVKTPNGFQWLVTVRDLSQESLLDTLENTEILMIERGCSPAEQKSYSGSKSVKKQSKSDSNEELCPKCGAPIEIRTTKSGKNAGRKYKVCSENEYNSDEGCDYFDWINDGQVSGTANNGAGGGEPATEPQKNLILKIAPNQAVAGLTKSEASRIIEKNL